MKFPIKPAERRRIVALTAAGGLVVASLVTITAAAAQAAPGCDVTYTTSDWTSSPGQGGFTASVTVKNTGDPITSWNLGFAFPAGQTLTQGWSANWSASGANVTATNLSWNGSLGTGASTNIGFNGTWTGSNPKPATFKVNGVTCGGAPANPTIVVTPTSLSVPEGGSASINVKLNTAPSGNVVVALARTGDTDITVPASVTLTTANWSGGVNAMVSAAEDADQANGTATIAASATGYTAASVAVTEVDNDVPVGTHVDNPYAGAGGYVNPDWKAKAVAETGGSRIANVSTGVWLDRIAAIAGSSSAMGLRAHLDAALAQDAANGSTPLTIQFVIYNLPNRDCSALASNGELLIAQNGLNRYKTEYIDPIAAIMGEAQYAALRIVTVIEIDSLPNLITNLNVAKCQEAQSSGAYVQGIQYALNKLHAITNVYTYIDAAHHGWIGWDTNFGPAAQLFASTAQGTTAGKASVDGFITNTANYSALVEPYFTINTTVNGTSVRQARWVDWNFYIDEQSFAQALRTRLVAEGFAPNIGMIIDTSRNGWGGTARPTGPSTSTVLDTFVNESRIDRRIHAGNWCNQSGAGLGERPQANPATGIDAYVWIKPPGESDGSSTEIPNNEGKGFDRMCDPTYGGNERNGNNLTGALPNSPLSGAWFSAQFQQLMANAHPAL